MQVKFAFNLSRVYEHYRRKHFSIVSAYLADSSTETNVARAAALKKEVRSRGYGFVEMEGHWIYTRGKKKGQDIPEYPLFIPECSYEDAIYFGSGKYYSPEPLPQETIIFADQEKILLLGSTPNGSWVVWQEFERLQANLGKALERWYERRKELAARGAEEQDLTEEEVKRRDLDLPQEEGMGWSVLNPKSKPRAWKFSHVVLSMIEPPDKNEPASSQGDAMKKFYWDDRKGYEFYRPLKTSGSKMVVYRGGLYQKKE